MCTRVTLPLETHDRLSLHYLKGILINLVLRLMWRKILSPYGILIILYSPQKSRVKEITKQFMLERV